MKCASCNNLYHPSTGHMHTKTCVLCGVCARDFVKWLKDYLNMCNYRKWTHLPSNTSFGAAAATSLIKERINEQ